MRQSAGRGAGGLAGQGHRTALAPRFERLREVLPDGLRAARRFVLWRWELRDGKWTKPPYQPTGRLASADDPSTWVDFELAQAAVESGLFDGLGIVLNGDGLVGPDFDHCVDDGVIADWALPAIKRLGSYTELSPSGTGIRVLAYGKLPPGGRSKAKGGHKIEVYDSGRYLTLTGHDLEGFADRIEERTELLGRFHAWWFGEVKADRPEPNGKAPRTGGMTAYEVVDLARKARNADKFERLMRGDLGDYGGDDSAADAALCSLLAFYTRDAGAIEQIVGMSQLGQRAKWTNRRDYRERTIAFALEHVTETYELPADGEQQTAELRELISKTATPAKEPAPVKAPAPPEAAPPEAFYGPFGELVDLIENYVESDRASVLAQTIVAYGVAVGIRPHFMVGATRHPPTLYLGLLGRSSRGRKGTGLDAVEVLFRLADPPFAERIFGGVGSGERLVGLVRDPDPDNDDEGAHDRRLLLREPELARLLAVINREGSTLSAYLREAFDGKQLRNEVKRSRSVATIHHIGMIGHCTAEELRDKLSDAQIRNGLANRILWILGRRAKRIPTPPVFAGKAVEKAALELQARLAKASAIHRLERSPDAEAIWDEWYKSLPDDEPGLVPAITERAEALVTRLATVYALSDASPVVETQHLCAALALWDYSGRCVEYIWGATTGDPLADRVLEDLAYGPMLQSELAKDTFGGNTSASTIARIGLLLERQGRIVRVRAQTDKPGRPPIEWRRTR